MAITFESCFKGPTIRKILYLKIPIRINNKSVMIIKYCRGNGDLEKDEDINPFVYNGN